MIHRIYQNDDIKSIQINTLKVQEMEIKWEAKVC